MRSCLPQGCGHIIDELLHAHFEDHNKTLYYGQIVGSIIANDRADAFIIRLCELINALRWTSCTLLVTCLTAAPART